MSSIIDLENIKKEICIFLTIPESLSKYFEIIGYDPVEKIYYIHYISELLSKFDETITIKEINIIKSLRGRAICLKDECFNIITGFGFTNNLDLFIKEPSVDVIEGINQNEEVFSLPIINCSFKTCFDGTMIKISKYNDEIIFSTNKNYKAENSRWGSSETFSSLFLLLFFGNTTSSLNDLKNILFSSDKKSSNITYTFLLTHPSLVNASQKDYGSGKLYYIEKFFNNDEIFDIENIETSNFWEAPETMIPPSINFEEALEYLKKGEDVICDYKIGTKDFLKIRLIPSDSRKRLNFLENSSNLYELYVKKIHFLNDNTKKVEFLNNLIDSCPLHKKIEVSKFFENYTEDLKNCISILTDNFDIFLLKINQNKLINDLRFKKGKILNSAGKTIERIITQTSLYTKKNSKISIKDSIFKLIKSEKNIYQLIIKLKKDEKIDEKI